MPPSDSEKPSAETLAELREDLRLLEYERVQASYDLHDGPLQDLVAASMFLEAMTSDLKGKGIALPAHAERAIATLRHGIAGIRKHLSGEVVDLAAEQLPLEQAVAEVATQKGKELGLSVEVTCEANMPAMARIRKRSVLLILEEALRNVWRHSGELKVSVKLTQPTAGRFRLEVKDTGKGFDPVTDPAGHYGMRGMRQRASWIGAELEIQSTVGEGTTLIIVGVFEGPGATTDAAS